jgi:hypothetical protein
MKTRQVSCETTSFPRGLAEAATVGCLSGTG